MTYEIKKNKNGYSYDVINKISRVIIKENIDLEEANKICWQEKNPTKRYQIFANSWAVKYALTWYEEKGGLIVPNSYKTIEDARLDIITDITEMGFNNDYETYPNPESLYSIIDTFTGESIAYSINAEKAYPLVI